MMVIDGVRKISARKSRKAHECAFGQKFVIFGWKMMNLEIGNWGGKRL